jgi:hydrogenase nickel incorporation protein HypB
MCATCGCEGVEHGHDHEHDHDHDHHHHHHGVVHEHVHGHEHERKTVVLERKVLEKNDRIAAANRLDFERRGVLAINLVSSPGAGKTTLLERTVREAGLVFSVIEGDQATDRDAVRIRAAGAAAVQVNTGTGCHLDARMVRRAAEELAPARGSVLAIENVGNLVCPALFDLGERAKVLVASVTEGDDKPLKYPHMFRASSLVLLNKIDLAPHVAFDAARFAEHARAVNPGVRVLEVSATRCDGLDAWFAWLRERVSSVAFEQEARR